VLDLELASGWHRTVLAGIGRPLAHDIAHDGIAGVVPGQAVECGDPAAQCARVGGRHRSAGPTTDECNGKGHYVEAAQRAAGHGPDRLPRQDADEDENERGNEPKNRDA
jgi:hypothetical protein